MTRAVFRTAEEGARPARLDRDRGLVEAARRDPSHFDALYRKYLAQVYSFAYYELRDHHAAEDATERVFMQALAGLPRFEERVDAFIASRAPLSTAESTDISTFRVWLFRIARNVVANERRRDRRRPVSSLAAAAELAAPDAVVDSAARGDRRRMAGRGPSARGSPPGRDPALRRRDVYGGDRRDPGPL